MSDYLLRVKGLTTRFATSQNAVVTAVNDVSFDVGKGETVGIVGESGCGKSVTSLSIMRLIPSPPGQIASGQVVFQGIDLLSLGEERMRQVRGNKIAMVFQEPMTSLNPLYAVGDQIAETSRLHQGLSKRQGWAHAVEMLRMVGIPLPERRVKEYPHQMSGGMRQRVMIAIALCCKPELLIADEPTTALDVTIQVQILEKMRELQDTFGTSVVLITHDLGVIAQSVKRVLVMYAGRVVEEAPVEQLFRMPLHPYTSGLMKSIPRLDTPKTRLYTIPGEVSDLMNLPKGCSFFPRCEKAQPRCREENPELAENFPGHKVRCWYPNYLIGRECSNGSQK